MVVMGTDITLDVGCDLSSLHPPVTIQGGSVVRPADSIGRQAGWMTERLVAIYYSDSSRMKFLWNSTA